MTEFSFLDVILKRSLFVGLNKKSTNHTDETCETVSKRHAILRIPPAITSKGNKVNRRKNDKHFIKKKALLLSKM